MEENINILSDEVDRELLEQFRCLSALNRESVIAALAIFLSAQEGSAYSCRIPYRPYGRHKRNPTRILASLPHLTKKAPCQIDRGLHWLSFLLIMLFALYEQIIG